MRLKPRIRGFASRFADKIWYGDWALYWLLLPFTLLFMTVVWLRRRAYQAGIFKVHRLSVPVIVVGGITVGGTGKTPLVIWLAQHLAKRGYRPGVAVRGYGGRARHWPQQVRADSAPDTVGDEAVVIARSVGCPVAAGPDRFATAQALTSVGGCNVIICDDGLQHYRLGRDIEIAVIDGMRRFGNGFCLPAGPLREPRSRLKSVDMVVTRGVARRGEFAMTYRAGRAMKVLDRNKVVTLETFRPVPLHAVAGIGNAEQFFDMLEAYDLKITPHAFSDHHPFEKDDFDFDPGAHVIMTEKDAVKCEHFASERWWSVPVAAELPEVFYRRLDQMLEKLLHG